MAGNVITSSEALGGIPTGDMYDDGTDLWIQTNRGLERLTSREIATAQEGEVGWDGAVLFKHGTYTTPIAYGTVVTDDLILRSTHITATPTVQNVVGEVVRIGTEAANTGYFTGIYSYMTTDHDCGGSKAMYAEVDINGTSALAGNHQGLLAEIVVGSTGVITGAGKISGITVEVDVVAGATVAQPIHGIEVDMRGIKADVVGETIGIKVTEAGGSNYLDYGMQFSNCFDTATAVINFDLTQGNTAAVILCESGAHVIASYQTFTNTTGSITSFADFTGYGSGEGEIIEKDANAATDIWGKLKIINTDGASGYINIYSTAN